MRDIAAEALVNLAEAIATFAHLGQRDKNGEDYIAHPRAVYFYIRADDECDYEGQVVAWLHDVVEDTDVTLEDLAIFFSPYIVEAVRLLSRNMARKGDGYYEDIKAHPLALRVKLKDIQHNTSKKRTEKLTADKRGRLKIKYDHALEVLTS